MTLKTLPFTGSPRLALVAARARNGVIGRDNDLPWRLKSDLKLFRETTLFKPVIMGRKTWESLPKKPLPGRLNLVLTKDVRFEAPGAVICHQLDEALEIAREHAREDGADEVCVIGGAALYALTLPRADRLYLTEVEAEVEGDARFPDLDPDAWTLVREQAHAPGDGDDYGFTLRVWDRRR